MSASKSKWLIVRLFMPMKMYLIPIPIVGFLVGSYFDRQESLRMTRYRDKSALYGRELQPGEPPSWPTRII